MWGCTCNDNMSAGTHPSDEGGSKARFATRGRPSPALILARWSNGGALDAATEAARGLGASMLLHAPIEACLH